MAKTKPFAKLRARAVQLNWTQKMIANLLGISVQAVNGKLAGRIPFSAKEMKILKYAMDLNSIDEYFFED